MVTNHGNHAVYIGATEGRPVPPAAGTYRQAHTPQQSRPTGLDWSKHRAPDSTPDKTGPRAKARAERNRQVYGTDLTPDVEDLNERRFHAPGGDTHLERTFAKLEAARPDDAAAASGPAAPAAPHAPPQPSTPAPAQPPAETVQAATTAPAAREAPTPPAAVLDQLIDQLATIRATAPPALGVADRKVKKLQAAKTRVEADLKAIETELADTTRRRDYLAANPDLSQPTPTTDTPTTPTTARSKK